MNKLYVILFCTCLYISSNIVCVISQCNSNNLTSAYDSYNYQTNNYTIVEVEETKQNSLEFYFAKAVFENSSQFTDVFVNRISSMLNKYYGDFIESCQLFELFMTQENIVYGLCDMIEIAEELNIKCENNYFCYYNFFTDVYTKIYSNIKNIKIDDEIENYVKTNFKIIFYFLESSKEFFDYFYNSSVISFESSKQNSTYFVDNFFDNLENKLEQNNLTHEFFNLLGLYAHDQIAFTFSPKYYKIVEYIVKIHKDSL